MKMIFIFISILFVHNLYAATINDPLPSWNEGPIKQNIIHFVNDVTTLDSPDYVAPNERIAVFDNDGTLWVEHPIYTQVIFALSRIKTLAPKHPEWKTQEPFKSALNGNYNHLTTADFEKIMAVSHSGMSVETFSSEAKKWLATAKNPRFQQLYTQLVYQPMLEVMQYLRQNNFKIYIVSGGGQDFMRAFSPKTYAVPSEQIIGSTIKTNYIYQNNKPQLIKTPQILFIDDHQGKPEAINLFIGMKPIIAFGNSDGDREMLEWTQSNPKRNLMLLVHHDDAKREYAYDTQTKVGTFSTQLMQEAQQNHWQAISMKNDWKTIFAK